MFFGLGNRDRMTERISLADKTPEFKFVIEFSSGNHCGNGLTLFAYLPGRANDRSAAVHNGG